MNQKKPQHNAQQNQRSDALNTNRGTTGSNKTNAHANGNRGKQLNPNQK